MSGMIFFSRVSPHLIVNDIFPVHTYSYVGEASLEIQQLYVHLQHLIALPYRVLGPLFYPPAIGTRCHEQANALKIENVNKRGLRAKEKQSTPPPSPGTHHDGVLFHDTFVLFNELRVRVDLLSRIIRRFSSTTSEEKGNIKEIFWGF